MRRSLQEQNARPREQTETNNTKKHQPNKNRKTGQANKKGGSHKHQPGQKATRRADKTKQDKGRGVKKASGGQQTRKERTPGEGSRGRREKSAQAKKAGACSFSGVLRGFWITQGRIPQCRSEGNMNNTHNMV